MPAAPQIDPVVALRSRVDLSEYVFPPTSPRWLIALSKVAENDLGALALLGPGGLHVPGVSKYRRVSLDAVSLLLTAFATSVRATGRHVAVGLPPGGRHLPLLIASASILADAIQRAQALAARKAFTRLSGVLVVSTDLDIRSRYSDLRVQNEALDTAYPGSRMKPTGEQVPLRPAAGQAGGKGVCFLLPGQNLPRTNIKPALAIIDLRYGRLSKRARDIALWSCRLHAHTEVLALYTLGDRDTVDALTKLGFDDLPIDHSAVATCSCNTATPSPDSGPVELSLLKSPSYLDREHEVIPIAGNDLEPSLITARRTICEQQQQEGLGLNRARWILATLTHMPVPLVWYEQSARNFGRSTLSRLIDHLLVRYDEGTGATMQSLKMQFEAVAHRLQTNNPRAVLIKSLLPQMVQDAGRVLLLVRDRVVQRALQNWLDLEAFPGAPWLQNVEIRACPDYSPISGERYPLVVVNGTFPRRYRWIAGAALGHVVKFLAYSSEIDSITNQLGEVYADQFLLSRSQQRDRTLCGIVAKDDRSPRRREGGVSPLRLKRPPKPPDPKKPEAVVVRNLLDLSGTFAAATKVAEQKARELEKIRCLSWEDAADEEVPGDSEMNATEEPAHKDDVSCVQLYVLSSKQGDGFLWLAEDDVVECVLKSSREQISRVTADELQVEDILILVEEDARYSLFDRVVDLAQDQPNFRYLAAFRKAWQDAMRMLAAKYDCPRYGYSKALEELRNAGSSITTELSVRNWVMGRVIGPDDLSSIKAVGTVIDFEPLIRDARDFDKAFRTIRGVHQGLGRRLTRAIRESSRNLVARDEPQEPDSLTDYIWLPMTELLETVDLAEVRGLSENPSMIAPHRVGRFIPTG